MGVCNSPHIPPTSPHQIIITGHPNPSTIASFPSLTPQLSSQLIFQPILYHRTPSMSGLTPQQAQKAPEDAPTAPLLRSDRPLIVGPESPNTPYPLFLRGCVQKGFGRGSKELGVPTANLPDESILPLTSLSLRGVYYGYARVVAHPTSGASKDGLSTPATRLEDIDCQVHPMVMSVGWNPYYKNERLTAEVHVMHEYASDFYSHEILVVVAGYIRPELNYISKEALIDDINTDKQVALNSLARPAYVALKESEFLHLPEKHSNGNGPTPATNEVPRVSKTVLGRSPLGEEVLPASS